MFFQERCSAIDLFFMKRFLKKNKILFPAKSNRPFFKNAKMDTESGLVKIEYVEFKGIIVTSFGINDRKVPLLCNKTKSTEYKE